MWNEIKYLTHGHTLARALGDALAELLSSAAGDDPFAAKIAGARLKHLAGRVAEWGGEVRGHVDALETVPDTKRIRQ
jgi:hypothetical protein